MSQLEIYFNTVPIEGAELKEAQFKAGGQNEIIYDIYLTYPNIHISPSDIFHYLSHRWPLTSIRRSLTTLTKLGYLEKTGELKTGMYGRPENIWKLK